MVITPENLKKMAKGLIDPHLTMLNGLVVQDNLPPKLKEILTKMREELNSFLTGLQPLDQVPAAEQMGWAMNNMQHTLERVGCIMDQVNLICGCYGGVRIELNSATEKLAALEKRVTDGALVPKETSQAAVDAAADAARKELLPAVVASRKKAVELAGLPVPADDILGLPEAAFAPRQEQALKNLGLLTGKGLSLKGADGQPGRGAALITKSAWHTAEEFAGSMKTFEDLLAPAAAAGARRGTDPLLGAGAAGAGAGTEPKARIRFC